MSEHARHPIQPLVVNEHGTVRFKANAICKWLVDSGRADLNEMARMDFSDEDREQFAQLIGYSLSGFGELHYVSQETYAAAEEMHRMGVTESQARIAALTDQLADARIGVRQAATALFAIHPDDLEAR